MAAKTLDRWEDVLAFALTLPDSYMESFYGVPSPKVNKKAFVSRSHEADTSFHVPSQHDEKAVLLETDPDTFWQTPHYEGWPAVLIRFDSPDSERVCSVIERSRDWTAAMKPPRSRKKK